MSRGLFKQTEQEAYRIILQIQNPQFQILHVRSHQDEVKTIEELDIPAKLNIEATIKARTPINTDLLRFDARMRRGNINIYTNSIHHA